jgi:hypothetical protein
MRTVVKARSFFIKPLGPLPRSLQITADLDLERSGDDLRKTLKPEEQGSEVDLLEG